MEWFRVKVKKGKRERIYVVPSGSEKGALDKVKELIRRGEIK